MRIDHATGRDAFVDELDRLLAVTAHLDDHDLFAASRCRGWAVADVVTHVHLGLQEMLLGIVSPTDEPATVDAATYWSSGSPSNDDEATGTDHVRFVRLLTSAYHRPSGSVRHLAVTGSALSRAARDLPEGNLSFQGQVIDTGDFFTTWAVELAVHHLDLALELNIEPPTDNSRDLARRTIEELSGGTYPASLDDLELILIGTGRQPSPGGAEFSHLRIPALT